MLESLITSKTRIKILLKFFINPDNQSYLRELAEEFQESTNGIRIELNRLTDAGLLQSSSEGKIKIYKANTQHSYFNEIKSLVHKYVGIDKILEHIIYRLFNVKGVFITGDYANGIDSGIIDLTIIGVVDQDYLQQLVKESEVMIQRKIRVTILSEHDYSLQKNKFMKQKLLLIWKELV